MKTLRNGMLALGLVGLLIQAGQAAETILPMSPEGQVWEKQVPAFVTVYTKSKKPFEILSETELDLNRYAAQQRTPDGRSITRIKPLVIEFPAWDWQPGDRRDFLVYLPLPPGQAGQPFPYSPPGSSFFLGTRDASRVASVSFQGAYAMENVLPRLRELRQWVEENHLVVIGPPRLLLFNYRDLMFDFWRSAELQVPIR